METLAQIRLEGRYCEACPLGKTAKSTVVYRGLPDPFVLFVGQSPGAEEDEAGVPFVGRSGKELDAKLNERPFPAYGITNAVLHHPPGNTYAPENGVACQPFLTRIVEAASPKVVVTLGRDAWDAVQRLALKVPVIRLPHPAAMLYNPNYRAAWNMGWEALWERLPQEGWTQ